MTSTVARTFGPALSEEYSPVVLAGGGGGGGGVAVAYPLVMVESDTARVSCQSPVVSSRPFFWGRSPWMWSVWALVSPIGFGGNPASFDRQVSRDELYSSGRNPGRWTCRGGASSGTVRAFGSGKAPGWLSARADACAGIVRAFGSGDCMDRWTFGGDACSGAVRAFGSRKVLAREANGRGTSFRAIRAFGSGKASGRWIT